MKGDDVAEWLLLVATYPGSSVGCGALKLPLTTIAEVKRWWLLTCAGLDWGEFAGNDCPAEAAHGEW